ncbi:MAG: hypothetical protein ACK51S_13685 [Alphaproteobacteria bacterium]|jgi:hypothetical protein
MADAGAGIAIAPEAITITWMVAGGIIVQLVLLVVFMVRITWWLSGRFAMIDAALAANAREAAAIKADVSNDIAGRKVVAKSRADIAQIKATLVALRERVDRLETGPGRRGTA